jgi:HD-like signal output (HDOD) protein/CheY-like chemotaxis protein
MRRVLMVDDEKLVLEGLEDSLFRYRKEWKMSFACGGAEALAHLSAEPFDVIISDVRMPGMDGVALLSDVRDRYPGVLRLVLTGNADGASARTLTEIAHRVLNKPCRPEVIFETVERACDLYSLLDDEWLRSVIGHIGHLPAMPLVYAKLTQLLAGSEVSAAAVARVIESDPSLAAKVLQVVNSGVIGLSRTVTSLESAVNYLGADLLLGLVFSLEAMDASAAPEALGFDFSVVRRHGLLTAKIARSIVQFVGDTETARARDVAPVAFTAGLVHNIGLMLLGNQLSDRFGALVSRARAQAVSLRGLERSELGTTRAEIGAYLLGLWNFPADIVEAVAFHHEAGRVRQREFGVIAALHVASALASEILPLPCEPVGQSAVDLEYCAQVGVAGGLDEWRSAAAALLEPEGQPA